MKFNYIMSILVYSLVLLGCSDQVEMDPISSVLMEEEAFIDVPDTSIVVSLQTAKTVATSFSKNRQSRWLDSEIDNIVPIVNEEGGKVAYIINYSDNSGFIVVSASRKYVPILAFSERGSFSSSGLDRTGLSDWIKRVSMIQNEIDSIPTEMQIAWASEWLAYSSLRKKIVESRADVQLTNLIRIATNKWRSSGYAVYSLKDYKNTTEYRMLDEFTKQEINEASWQATSQFGDRDEVCFMLVGSESKYSGVSRLTLTQWGQQNGYNYGNVWKHPAGCVAVAMGQIMKYHRWPQNYAWDDMPNNQANQTIADFLYEIGDAVQMDYKPLGSGSTLQKAYNAFKNTFNYPSVVVDDLDFYTILSDLKNYGPVFVGSYVLTQQNLGHAWVCDGAIETETFTGKRLMVLPSGTINTQLAENSFVKAWESGGTYKTQRLRMNWGDEGNGDGLYEGTTWTFKGYELGYGTQIIRHITPGS